MGDNLARNQSVPNFNRVPLVVVLILGAFVSVLNQTLLGTALPKIMVDLHLTENAGQWLQSAFLLVNGIMIPITAFFIGRFTTRRLFLTAVGLFSLGTLTSAISGSFEVLLFGRILQAAGAGIMMPLLQTIIMLIFPIEKRGTAMGMFGLVIAFAPAIGPALSGYIVEVASWRWLFWMILPICQIAGSIGTALSITLMTLFTIPEKGIEGMIHGVNISFVFAGITSLIGLIMAFYVKDRRIQ